MATDLENLRQTRSDLIRKRAEIAAETDHFLTYSDQGRSYSWTEYMEMLGREIDSLTKQIAAIGPPVRTRSYSRAV